MTDETGIDALTADIVANLDVHAPAVGAVMDKIDAETLAVFVRMIVESVETIGGFDLSTYEIDDDDDDDDEDEDEFSDDELDDRWDDDDDEEDE